MCRVLILLSINILLNYSDNALGTPDTEVDADKIDEDLKASDDGDDDIKKQRAVLGIDYYNGVGSSRQEYDEDDTALKLKSALMESGDENIVILDTMDTRNYRAEMQAGNKADILGTNLHYYQPNAYPDFSRRFVLQYPYTEVDIKNKDNIEKNKLTPKLAPPKLVLQVAKESAMLDKGKQKDSSIELIRKDILRTGDYWNSVWKEEVDPQVLRTKNAKQLESVRAEIRPGSKLYDLVSKLNKLSPRILYVINDKNS